MHFRVRKNVIQLIRIAYDKGKKKGITSVVGSVRLDQPELSPELKAMLTADEIAAFRQWVNRQHRADALREELAALTLAETLAAARKWFEQEGASPIARSCAADVLAHWQMLRKVLVKNGLLDGVEQSQKRRSTE